MASAVSDRIRYLTEHTPATRNRYVDFLRAAAILIVVAGHWLAAAIWIGADGALQLANILELAPWTHRLTWLIQIMPVFFIVGGFANARSLASARQQGSSMTDWVTTRFRRLVTPLTPLVVVWLAILALGALLGLDGEMLATAAKPGTVAVWFLAVYAIGVALAPATSRLWERWHWRTLVIGIAAAVIVDSARLVAGFELLGWLNFVFVWLTLHQLGYAWAEWKRPLPRSAAATIAAAALVTLVILTSAGPYPVAMVGVPGAATNNTLPPTAALIVLGVFQFGLAMVLQPTVNAWLQRPRAWATVIRVNAQIMTLYLWHLSALVVLAGAGLALGVGLGTRPLTTDWWLSRPLWLGAAAAVTAVFLAIFGRFEHEVRSSVLKPWRLFLGIPLAVTSLSMLAYFGLASADGGLNRPIVVLFVLAVLLLGAWPRRIATRG